MASHFEEQDEQSHETHGKDNLLPPVVLHRHLVADLLVEAV